MGTTKKNEEQAVERGVSKHDLVAAGLFAKREAGVTGTYVVDLAAPTADGRNPAEVHARRERARMESEATSARVATLRSELEAAREAAEKAEAAYASGGPWKPVADAREAIDQTMVRLGVAKGDHEKATTDHEQSVAELAHVTGLRLLETIAAPLMPEREMATAVEHAREAWSALANAQAALDKLQAVDASAVTRWEDACRAADAIGATRPARPQLMQIARHVVRAAMFGGDDAMHPHPVSDTVYGHIGDTTRDVPLLEFLTTEAETPRTALVAVVPNGATWCPPELRVGTFGVIPDSDDPVRVHYAEIARHMERIGPAEVVSIAAENKARVARYYAGLEALAAKVERGERTNAFLHKQMDERDAATVAASAKRESTTIEHRVATLEKAVRSNVN